jgi:hypothetical protein
MTLGPLVGELSGQCRYSQQGDAIWLTQVNSDPAKISLDEQGRRGDEIPGVFRGKIDPQHAFAGIWTSGNGEESQPFHLDRVADLVHLSNENKRYKITSTYPQFLNPTPFHTALNKLLANRAKKEMGDVVKEYDKTTSEPDPGPLPCESSVGMDVVYSDDSLISICSEAYEYTGGAHGNTGYNAILYTWRNNQLVELHAKDFLQPDSRDSLNALLLADLQRQKAANAKDVVSIKTSDLVINPTSEGLLFTFGPYEVDCYAAGTFSVVLPYKSLTDIINPKSEIAKMVKAR